MAKNENSSKASQNYSIFSCLKTSGENFFQNKELLNDVRTNCEIIFKDHSQKLKQKFDISFPLKSWRPIEFEKNESRPQITAAEENLIKKACKNKNIHETKIENIKFSLGYKTENSSFKKPCIAVVGQTKAGKSSLINCILQERVVPQKVSRQTARVTRVTHCPVKFVAHMENSRLIKIELEEDIRSEDVDLSFKDRNKERAISIEIIVGTPNPIIQNGFDLIDSPGLNENPSLNDLCSKMERSLLPVLIYVIEGRNGLTQTDIEDIKQIKLRTPELKILFFVTKLARSKYDRVMYLEYKAKKGLKDMPGESDIEVAKRRLDNVLRKLKLHAFVPVSTNILESRVFHGADIWAVNEMRIHNPNAIKNEFDEFNMKLMQCFEESLMLYLKDRLEGPIKEAIQNIQGSLEEIIEKTTYIASDIKEKQHLKLKNIQYFKEFERGLFLEEMKYFRDIFPLKFHKFVQEYFEQFAQESESSKRQYGPEEKIYPFDYLLDNLIPEIESFLGTFIKECHSRLDLSGILYEGEKNSFKQMLQNRLFYEYNITAFPNRKWFDKSKLRKTFSRMITNEQNDAYINNDSIPQETIVTRVLSYIQNELKNNHERFVQQIHEEETFLKFENIGIEEKKLLQSFSEQVVVQYAVLLHLKTTLEIVIDPLRPSEIIGVGGQATVKKVHVIGQDEPIVCKNYNYIFPSFLNSPRLLTIGMEIYYSSRLQHPRLLQLLGIHFENNEGGWRFTAYYPYLRMGTLKDYLSSNGDNITLRERMRLAVQIAEGIRFMHQIQIVHRDINLNNVLVSDNQSEIDVFISDYGLSKSFGFLEYTDRIGTSIYRAPELLSKSYLLKHSYDQSIDVFSFSLSLWQLISYKLLPEYSNYYPRFITDCEHNADVCEKLVLSGARPEYRKSIPPRLFTLMQRCWDGHPHRRPSFFIPPNLNEEYSSKNKTIVDELKEIEEEIVRNSVQEKYEDFNPEISSMAFKFPYDSEAKFGPDSENSIIGKLIREFDEFGSVVNLPLRGYFFQVAENHKESLNEAWNKLINFDNDAIICSTPYLFECAEPVTEFILLFCLKSQTIKGENMLELQGKLLPNNYINKKLKYPLVLSFEVKLNLDPTRNQEGFYDQTFSGEIHLSEIDCYSKTGIPIPVKSEIKKEFPQIFLKVTKINDENVKTS